MVCPTKAKVVIGRRGKVWVVGTRSARSYFAATITSVVALELEPRARTNGELRNYLPPEPPVLVATLLVFNLVVVTV